MLCLPGGVDFDQRVETRFRSLGFLVGALIPWFFNLHWNDRRPFGIGHVARKNRCLVMYKT